MKRDSTSLSLGKREGGTVIGGYGQGMERKERGEYRGVFLDGSSREVWGSNENTYRKG